MKSIQNRLNQFFYPALLIALPLIFLSPSFSKTVVHGGSLIPHPFGLSLFEHNVYYTDWTKMAVMKVNKFNDRNPQVVYTTSQIPHGLAVIHSLNQPYGKLNCSLSKPSICFHWLPS
jgi:hypothetical protein